MDKIFISISGIDEIDVKQTVTSCLENADNPESVVFGLCVQYQQYKPDVFDDIKNARVVKISSEEILGVGMARTISYALNCGEKYFLLIDAHMLFEKGWDTRLINYYLAAKKINDKMIISGYAPSWYRNKDNNIIREDFDKKSLTLVNSDVAEQPIVGFDHNPEIININSLKLIKQKAASCHFIFTETKNIKNFLPDPEIIYNGDEATLSLRLYSQGYDILCPDETILWHLNKTIDNFYSNEKIKWQPLFLGKQKSRSSREEYITYNAYNKVKDIFSGDILGYYGAKSKNDIIEYEKFLGINFKDSFQKKETK